MRYPASLLARIADTLADLFTERGDLRTLLDEAGIKAYSVNLEQDARSVWGDVVREANNLGLVRSLLTVALRRYESGPARETLMALEAGLAAAENARRFTAPTGVKKSGSE